MTLTGRCLGDGLFHHALAVPVSANDHAQGTDSAAVTLVLYGDYQCPYTTMFHQVVTKLQVRFGAQFRYVFRHFPSFTKHANAQLAAETAEAAAAQGKFWEMQAYLFQEQYDFNRDRLAAACSLLNLDYVRLDREISGHAHLEHVQADVDGGKRSGVSSTPTAFINGLMYDGSDDFDALARFIETLAPLTKDKKGKSFLGSLFRK